MQIGKFPSDAYLKQVNLYKEYASIGEAVREGNVGALEKALERNSHTYIQSGVYLALEKLRFQALRNLFKRIAKALEANP